MTQGESTSAESSVPLLGTSSALDDLPTQHCSCRAVAHAGTRWDVAIIGAGPAGLMAGARAAERGRKTILLDRNREPGVKILLSGGTRCNLTHATDARGIVEAFGPSGRFLHSALAALGPQDVVDLFAAEGVPTKVEPNGKVFPQSDRASDVRAALVRLARRAGCELALETKVEAASRGIVEAASRGIVEAASRGIVEAASCGIVEAASRRFMPETRRDAASTFRTAARPDAASTLFQLITAQGTIEAEKLILATGGQSYPACGTTGDGYRWAAAFGHRIVPPHTALVPITSHAPWVLALQGVTLPDVEVSVVDPAESKRNACRAKRRSALLFTHFGVSGPAVLDVSHAASGHPRPTTLLLRCDLVPSLSEGELDELLAQEMKAAAGKRRVGSLLDRWLPHRVGETVVAQSGTPLELPLAEFSKHARRRLAETAKRLDIPIAGTMGFRKAEVTAGGVALDEVDSRTMQSKLVPGLFFAGELLDLNGPEGGYNFQAAFSTGRLAGESV